MKASFLGVKAAAAWNWQARNYASIPSI